MTATTVPSPAERIAAAARRIRMASANVTPGPWRATSNRSVQANSRRVIASVWATEQWPTPDDAAFIAEWDPTRAIIVADLLDGMAAHWKLRPIGDWDTYRMTPLAALVRHVMGEEETA
jgi:hypothetical protein